MSGGPRPDPASDQRIVAEAERAKLVHNEQTKIRATLLNTVAAGFIVAGIITPIVTALRGEAPPSSPTFVLMVVWFLLAAALHYGALLTLERLR